MTRLTRLIESSRLFKHFYDLNQIPRPSGQERAAINMIKGFAENLGFPATIDAKGNLVVKRPGVQPTVIIQGHVDMVTEKNRETVHDFNKDPIKMKVETDENGVEWLRAEGTTLGSDNGIAVAAAMAILELPLSENLPAIECVFTVEEETGLYGAAELDPSLVSSNILLNLDSEEWGTVTIGCAGGAGATANVVLPTECVDATAEELKITVKGLIGGHSGINIHENRGNALRILAKALGEARLAVPSLRVTGLTGGDKDNAIPREAEASIRVASSDVETLKTCLQNVHAAVLPSVATLEPNFVIVTGAVDASASIQVTDAGLVQLLAAMSTLPHGVIAMSPHLENTTETSCNLAKVELSGASIQGVRVDFLLSGRSFHASALQDIRDSISAALKAAFPSSNSLKIIFCDDYPGWAPAPVSSLTDLAVAEMQQELDSGNTCGYHEKKVNVVAIHAGLECGVLNERLARQMDMVSYGPTITGAHSPDEQLRIDTVKPFEDMTLRILRNIASGKYTPLANVSA